MKNPLQSFLDERNLTVKQFTKELNQKGKVNKPFKETNIYDITNDRIKKPKERFFTAVKEAFSLSDGDVEELSNKLSPNLNLDSKFSNSFALAMGFTQEEIDSVVNIECLNFLIQLTKRNKDLSYGMLISNLIKFIHCDNKSKTKKFALGTESWHLNK